MNADLKHNIDVARAAVVEARKLSQEDIAALREVPA